jgi:hypothetical protein
VLAFGDWTVLVSPFSILASRNYDLAEVVLDASAIPSQEEELPV